MSKVEVVTSSRYQTGGTEDPAALVVHMTPESVLKTDQYKKWMERFAVSLSVWKLFATAFCPPSTQWFVSAGFHLRQNTWSLMNTRARSTTSEVTRFRPSSTWSTQKSSHNWKLTKQRQGWWTEETFRCSLQCSLSNGEVWPYTFYNRLIPAFKLDLYCAEKAHCFIHWEWEAQLPNCM